MLILKKVRRSQMDEKFEVIIEFLKNRFDNKFILLIFPDGKVELLNNYSSPLGRFKSIDDLCAYFRISFACLNDE